MGVPLFFAFTAGMVATLNPCGFAMLPAYVSMFLTDAAGERRTGAFAGLRIGAWVTVGFILTFSAFGIVTSFISQQILDLIPWAAIVIGLALVVGGVAVLFGLKLKVRAFDIRFTKKGTPGSMALFGGAYAVASISCTLPIFLAITTQALATDSVISGTAIIGSYGVGMGVVLVAIAVALASSRDYVVDRFRSLMPIVERIGGWLMIIAGAYIVYYWATNLALPVGSDSALLAPNRIVERISAWFVAGIGNNPWPWLSALLAVITITLAAQLLRSGRRSDPAAGVDGEDLEMATRNIGNTK